MLSLLDAFTPEKYMWDVDELSSRFGFPPSSTYRYVRELCKAGLLIRLPRGHYVVGARVVELDALIRETDPITRVGRNVLRDLASETGCHVLLANLYGNHVINVAHEAGLEQLDLAYIRGRPLPWVRGAPSKAILAFLPKARARQLFDIALGADATEERWKTMSVELRTIKREGYCVSRGELDPKLIGLGAPVVLESDKSVIGSISLVCTPQRWSILNEKSVGQSLRLRGQQLAALIADT